MFRLYGSNGWDFRAKYLAASASITVASIIMWAVWTSAFILPTMIGVPYTIYCYHEWVWFRAINFMKELHPELEEKDGSAHHQS